MEGLYAAFAGGSTVSKVANAWRLYEVSMKSSTERLAGSQPGTARSNKTVHCQNASLLSPPAQLSVIGGAGTSVEDDDAAPTNTFSIRHSLAPSYPISSDMDSDLPSNTIEREVRRSDAGRIIAPVNREVCGVTVIRTFPEREYAVL